MVEQRIQEYYERAHGDYSVIWRTNTHNHMHYGYFEPGISSHEESLHNHTAVLADRVGIGSDDRVMDGGCGRGGSSIWMASERGASVVGVDLTARHIMQSENNVREEGEAVSSKVDLVQADYTQTPFPDNTFDVCYFMETSCYAEDKRDLIQEAARILKPGGRIAVADGFLIRSNYNRSDARILKRWMNGWAIPELTSMDEFAADLEDIGFGSIECTDVTQHVLPSAKFMFATAIVTLPVSRLMEIFSLRTAEETGNVVAAVEQYPGLRNDLWKYGHVTARLA